MIPGAIVSPWRSLNDGWLDSMSTTARIGGRVLGEAWWGSFEEPFPNIGVEIGRGAAQGLKQSRGEGSVGVLQVQYAGVRAQKCC